MTFLGELCNAQCNKSDGIRGSLRVGRFPEGECRSTANNRAKARVKIMLNGEK